MGTLWAVLRREMWERRQVVWLGLFLGVLCPVFAQLPGGFRATQDLYESMALGVSLSYFLLMSFVVGLGLFAADQASGRMGFFLARPIRPWQLLVGRVVAAVTLLLLGTSLVLLPTFLLGMRPWLLVESERALAVASLTALMLAVTHVLAVALRLRGRWTLVDLGAFTASVLLTAATLRRAREAGLPLVPEGLALLAAAVVLGAAGLGVWMQLRRGGTLRGRLHAAFSVTFWLVVLSAVAAFDVKVHLSLAKDWTDIESFSEAVPSNDGSAVWLAPNEGMPRLVSYVLDLERGRRVTLDVALWFWRMPELKGRTVLWLGCDREAISDSRSSARGDCGYRLLRLDDDDPRPVRVPIFLEDQRSPRGLSLSPDGKRLAELSGRRLRFLDTGDLRPILEIELEGARHLAGFLAEGSALVLLRHRDDFRVATVDPDGSVRYRGLESRTWALAADSRFLIETSEGQRWLVDSDGTAMQNLPEEFFLDVLGRRMIGDWVVWAKALDRKLEARSIDGRRARSIELPPPVVQRGRSGTLASVLGPELEPGRVVASLGLSRDIARRTPVWERLDLERWTGVDLEPTFRRIFIQASPFRFGTPAPEGWTSLYVDLEEGTVVASFEGFRPLAQRIETQTGPEAWLLDERGLPHRFDPDHLDPDDPVGSLEPVFRPPWDDQ